MSIDPIKLSRFRADGDNAFRVYKRITFYNPKRELCVRSFFRLHHRGDYTYIESISVCLLPLVKMLYNSYKEQTTFQELKNHYTLARSFFFSDLQKRNRFYSVIMYGIIIGAIWICGGIFVEWNDLFWVNIPHLVVLLAILLITYGFLGKYDDIYESKIEIPFPLSLLLIFGSKERDRQEKLENMKICQEINEFDYGATQYSIRSGQSRRYEKNYFEFTELIFLQKTQELAIQEAFLECLEEAGIDTSDFREGTARINNYGIINSGQIQGNIKSEVSTEENVFTRRKKTERISGAFNRTSSTQRSKEQ